LNLGRLKFKLLPIICPSANKDVCIKRSLNKIFVSSKLALSAAQDKLSGINGNPENFILRSGETARRPCVLQTLPFIHIFYIVLSDYLDEMHIKQKEFRVTLASY
jgi:hypothetical protein